MITSASSDSCKVAILLATRNGAAYLRDQLDSFVGQTHSHWSLYASDDGSTDRTRDVLEAFRIKTQNPVHIRRGPELGYCENFMALARDRSIVADYYAFSDQDDVWLSEKLRRAISCLQMVPEGLPALYCSRTMLVDEQNETVLGHSPLFTKAPCFSNALVQNIGGGNTMVFNATAKRLLEESNASVVVHDWWTYQLVTGAGGIAIYDSAPSLRYRQHSANAIGSNAGWTARYSRAKLLLAGKYSDWNETNIIALKSVSYLLSPANRAQLVLFNEARSGRIASRIRCLRQSGVFRQTLLQNCGMYAAAVLGKL